MMPNLPNDLIGLWQRYDWRESLFAPSMAILQALLPDGSTASGAGRVRETALWRCLGETAEWQALRANGGAGFSPHRDGLAAHPDSHAARTSAMLEAFERASVIGWWSGRLMARPMASDWLADQGIAHLLTTARRGAAQKRRSGLWHIATQTGPAVMVCRTTSFRGQEPVLGFGCDPSPQRAAEKALREALLMEVNLMELLAAQSTGGAGPLAPIRHRIESYARRCPALLPTAGQITPEQVCPPPTPQEAEVWFGTTVDLRDITPPGTPIAVWLCRPAIPDPALCSQDDSPFL